MVSQNVIPSKQLLGGSIPFVFTEHGVAMLSSVFRSSKAFPEMFCFMLNNNEMRNLRSQFATLKNLRGKHSKYLLNAFTEQGVVMLFAVLKSEKLKEVC
jgi:hypothetical protein